MLCKESFQLLTKDGLVITEELRSIVVQRKQSVHTLAAPVGREKLTVHELLKHCKFHSFKIHFVQEQMEDDPGPVM